MAVCGNCGAETSRLTVKLTADGGKPLPEPLESCPYCDGSRERISSITDRKLWLGSEVYDKHYTKTYTPEGQEVYKASDSLISDLMDEWSKDPDAEAKEALRQRAIDWKRNHGNSISKTEAERIIERYRDFEARERALDAGLAIPEL